MLKNKSIYNMISGLIGQFVTLAVAILVPRLVLVNLGSEVNGLLNSVNQALVYLGLLESGVGTVTIQALYKPIASNNKESINEILAATSKFYRKTGYLYTLSVIVFSVIYPLVVKTEIPFIKVVLIILFSGLAGALNYFFQGKYRLLLQAEGKGYIISNLNTVIHILINAGKIVFLLLGFDAVELQAWYFTLSIGQMLFIAFYMKKHYTWLDLTVKPNFNAISQKSSVLVHQLCGLIFSNTDTIILTLFSGLKIVSVYSIYNLIYTQISNLISSLTTNSFMFALGQTYSKDKEQFNKQFDIFELCCFFLSFLLFSVLYICMIPLIRLYTKGINDAEYVNFWYNLLFCIGFLLSALRTPAQTAITVAGHFEKTKNRAILEAVINASVTLILVPFFGINGALLGTVTALLYRTNDMIIYTNKCIIQKKAYKSYRRILRYLFVFIVICVLGNRFIPECKTYVELMISAVVSGVIALFLFALVTLITEKNICQNLISTLLNRMKKNSSKGNC